VSRHIFARLFARQAICIVLGVGLWPGSVRAAQDDLAGIVLVNGRPQRDIVVWLEGGTASIRTAGLEPGAFLRVAEELGALADIVQWALAEACRQGQRWRREHPDHNELTVSVNLSAKAFGSESLVPLVMDVLRDTEFPARGLRLEITESVAISDADRVRSVLEELGALGVRVSLDDFGTGNCSLSYLQQFKVDTLKIDRSFVARIGEEEGHGEIIRLIVGLAHTLGLDVVAEGTETAAQVDYLAALGCGNAQGYYFAKPMAPEVIALSAEAANKVSLFTRDHTPPATGRASVEGQNPQKIAS